ncbi:MAG: hypothetical protein V7K40_01260 [Nostoc sp.]|uniref:hypothetical protein n=1 Tax=Nostoc sp. TaxID=1180 RepID=UPI002FF57070
MSLWELHSPVILSVENWGTSKREKTLTLQTFREYSQPFDIEENFLDDKAGGFELERSQFEENSPQSLLKKNLRFW